MSDTPRGSWLSTRPNRFPPRAEGGVPIDAPRLHRVRRPIGWEYREGCSCAFCIAERVGRLLESIRVVAA